MTTHGLASSPAPDAQPFQAPHYGRTAASSRVLATEMTANSTASAQHGSISSGTDGVNLPRYQQQRQLPQPPQYQQSRPNTARNASVYARLGMIAPPAMSIQASASSPTEYNASRGPMDRRITTSESSTSTAHGPVRPQPIPQQQQGQTVRPGQTQPQRPPQPQSTVFVSGPAPMPLRSGTSNVPELEKELRMREEKLRKQESVCSEQSKQIVKLLHEIEQLKRTLQSKADLEQKVQKAARTEDELKTLQVKLSMKDIEMEQLREQLEEQKRVAAEYARSLESNQKDTSRTIVTPRKRMALSPPTSPMRSITTNTETTERLLSSRRKGAGRLELPDEQDHLVAPGTGSLNLLEGINMADLEAVLHALDGTPSEQQQRVLEQKAQTIGRSAPDREPLSTSNDVSRIENPLNALLAQFTPEKTSGSLTRKRVKLGADEWSETSDETPIARSVRRNLRSALEKATIPGEVTAEPFFEPNQFDLTPLVLSGIESGDEGSTNAREALVKLAIRFLQSDVYAALFDDQEIFGVAARCASVVLQQIPIADSAGEGSGPASILEDSPPIGKKRNRSVGSEKNPTAGSQDSKVLSESAWRRRIQLLTTRLQLEIKWRQLIGNVTDLLKRALVKQRAELLSSLASTLLLGSRANQFSEASATSMFPNTSSSEGQFIGTILASPQSHSLRSSPEDEISSLLGSGGELLEIDILTGIRAVPNSYRASNDLSTSEQRRHDHVVRFVDHMVSEAFHCHLLDNFRAVDLASIHGKPGPYLADCLAERNTKLLERIRAIISGAYRTNQDKRKEVISWIHDFNQAGAADLRQPEKSPAVNQPVIMSHSRLLSSVKRKPWNSAARRKSKTPSKVDADEDPQSVFVEAALHLRHVVTRIVARLLSLGQELGTLPVSSLLLVLGALEEVSETIGPTQTHSIALLDPMYFAPPGLAALSSVFSKATIEMSLLDFAKSEATQELAPSNNFSGPRPYGSLSMLLETLRLASSNSPNGMHAVSAVDLTWRLQDALPSRMVSQILSKSYDCLSGFAFHFLLNVFPKEGEGGRASANATTHQNRPIPSSTKPLIAHILEADFLAPAHLAEEAEDAIRALISSVAELSVHDSEAITGIIDEATNRLEDQELQLTQSLSQGVQSQGSESGCQRVSGSLCERRLNAITKLLLRVSGTCSPVSIPEAEELGFLELAIPSPVLTTVARAHQLAHRTLTRAAFVVTDSNRLLRTIREYSLQNGIDMPQIPVDCCEVAFRDFTVSPACFAATAAASEAVNLLRALLHQFPSAAMAYIWGMTNTFQDSLVSPTVEKIPPLCGHYPSTLQAADNESDTVDALHQANAHAVAQRVSSGKSAIRYKVMSSSDKWKPARETSHVCHATPFHTPIEYFRISYPQTSPTYPATLHEGNMSSMHIPLPSLLGNIYSLIGSSGTIPLDITHTTISFLCALVCKCEAVLLRQNLTQTASQQITITLCRSLMSTMSPLVLPVPLLSHPFAAAVCDALALYSMRDSRPRSGVWAPSMADPFVHFARQFSAPHPLFSSELPPEFVQRLLVSKQSRMLGGFMEDSSMAALTPHLHFLTSSPLELTHASLIAANSISNCPPNQNLSPPLLAIVLCQPVNLECHLNSLQLLRAIDRFVASHTTKAMDVLGERFALSSSLRNRGFPYFRTATLSSFELNPLPERLLDLGVAGRTAAAAAAELLQICHGLAHQDERGNAIDLHELVTAVNDTLTLVKRVAKRIDSQLTAHGFSRRRPVPQRKSGLGDHQSRNVNFLELLLIRLLSPVLPMCQTSASARLNSILAAFTGGSSSLETSDGRLARNGDKPPTSLPSPTASPGASGTLEDVITKAMQRERNEVVEEKRSFDERIVNALHLEREYEAKRIHGLKILGSVSTTSYGLLPESHRPVYNAVAPSWYSVALKAYDARLAARTAWLRWIRLADPSTQPNWASTLSNSMRSTLATLTLDLWPVNCGNASALVGGLEAFVPCFLPEKVPFIQACRLNGDSGPLASIPQTTSEDMSKLLGAMNAALWLPSVASAPGSLATSHHQASSTERPQVNRANQPMIATPDSFLLRSLEAEQSALRIRLACVDTLSTYVKANGVSKLGAAITSWTQGHSRSTELVGAVGRVPNLVSYSTLDLWMKTSGSVSMPFLHIPGSPLISHTSLKPVQDQGAPGPQTRSTPFIRQIGAPGSRTIGFGSIAEMTSIRPSEEVLQRLPPRGQQLWKLLEQFRDYYEAISHASERHEPVSSVDVQQYFRAFDLVRWLPDLPLHAASPTTILIALQYASPELRDQVNLAQPLAVLNCALGHELTLLKETQHKREFVERWLLTMSRHSTTTSTAFDLIRRADILGCEVIRLLEQALNLTVCVQSTALSMLQTIAELRKQFIVQLLRLLVQLLMTSDTRCASVHSLVKSNELAGIASGTDVNCSTPSELLLRPILLPQEFRSQLHGTLNAALQDSTINEAVEASLRSTLDRVCTLLNHKS